MFSIEFNFILGVRFRILCIDGIWCPNTVARFHCAPNHTQPDFDNDNDNNNNNNNNGNDNDNDNNNEMIVYVTDPRGGFSLLNHAIHSLQITLFTRL